MQKAPIVEIFTSLEGEGLFIGTPTIFIRLAGCNVGCKFCDSKQTWNTEDYPILNVEQTITRVASLLHTQGIKRVSITGGEPLLYPHFVCDFCIQLRSTLQKFHIIPVINLETSGTIHNNEVFFAKYGKTIKHIDKLESIPMIDSISMDIKTPSSGVVLSPEMLLLITSYLNDPRFYFKAIVADVHDVKYIIDNFKYSAKKLANPLVLTPCESEGKLTMGLEDIQTLQLNTFINYRIIAQQHKLCSYR